MDTKDSFEDTVLRVIRDHAAMSADAPVDKTAGLFDSLPFDSLDVVAVCADVGQEMLDDNLGMTFQFTPEMTVQEFIDNLWQEYCNNNGV